MLITVILGRDDLLWISDKGSVTTWINHRNLSPGSIVPKWMPPLLTHGGPGIVGVRGRTSFGKMYSPSTRNQNYIVNTVDGANPGIMLYENQDNGGKFSNGDGVYNCEHVPSLSALPAGPVRALEWPFPREPTFFAIGVSFTQDFVYLAKFDRNRTPTPLLQVPETEFRTLMIYRITVIREVTHLHYSKNTFYSLLILPYFNKDIN